MSSNSIPIAKNLSESHWTDKYAVAMSSISIAASLFVLGYTVFKLVTSKRQRRRQSHLAFKEGSPARARRSSSGKVTIINCLVLLGTVFFLIGNSLDIVTTIDRITLFWKYQNYETDREYDRLVYKLSDISFVTQWCIYASLVILLSALIVLKRQFCKDNERRTRKAISIVVDVTCVLFLVVFSLATWGYVLDQALKFIRIVKSSNEEWAESTLRFAVPDFGFFLLYRDDTFSTPIILYMIFVIAVSVTLISLLVNFIYKCAVALRLGVDVKERRTLHIASCIVLPILTARVILFVFDFVIYNFPISWLTFNSILALVALNGIFSVLGMIVMFGVVAWAANQLN